MVDSNSHFWSLILFALFLIFSTLVINFSDFSSQSKLLNCNSWFLIILSKLSISCLFFLLVDSALVRILSITSNLTILLKYLATSPLVEDKRKGSSSCLWIFVSDNLKAFSTSVGISDFTTFRTLSFTMYWFFLNPYYRGRLFYFRIINECRIRS